MAGDLRPDRSVPEPGRHRAGRVAAAIAERDAQHRESTQKRVHSVRRHQLTPDGRWYPFRLSGPILAAGTRYEGLIEFWTLNTGDDQATATELAVFYDEQVVPTDARHVHTIITGRLVWHLFQRDPQ